MNRAAFGGSEGLIKTRKSRPSPMIPNGAIRQYVDFFHWVMICSTADSFYRMSVQSVRRTGAPGNDTCGVRSCQNIPDYMAVNVRQAIAPTLAPEGETFVVNAQKVQQGRLEVMHMDRIVCNVVPEIIGLAE